MNAYCCKFDEIGAGQLHYLQADHLGHFEMIVNLGAKVASQ